MNNCPNCGHDLVNVIYGMPGPKLIEMAKSEGIALGGCSMLPERPSHYCYGCNEEFTL
jgi:hypothetical protein